jgi:tetratricopeptide (TPR) repeat protein
MRLVKEIHPLLGSYQLKSGVYHFYRNEYPQAVKFLRKALDSAAGCPQGEEPIVRFFLTQTFLSWSESSEDDGDIEAALEACRRALDVEPGFPDLHSRLGRLLEQTGDLEEAAGSYRRATELNPEYAEAHRALGFVRLRAGAAEEAAEAFATVFSLAVATLETPYRTGLQALQGGDVEGAEQAMREAFFRRPDLFNYHYRQGLRRLKAGEFEAALTHLEAAGNLGHRFADLDNYLGVAYAELGRTQEAIGSFKRSIDCNPGYLAARLNLGFTCAGAGYMREAEEELARALELDPSTHAARAKLEEIRAAKEST